MFSPTDTDKNRQDELMPYRDPNLFAPAGMAAFGVAVLFLYRTAVQKEVEPFLDKENNKIRWSLYFLHLFIDVATGLFMFFLTIAITSASFFSAYVEWQIPLAVSMALVGRSVLPMLVTLAASFTIDYAKHFYEKYSPKSQGTPHKDGLACDYERDTDSVNKKEAK